jgi:DNA-binding NarL/FixJ family response regulator
MFTEPSLSESVAERDLATFARMLAGDPYLRAISISDQAIVRSMTIGELLDLADSATEPHDRSRHLRVIPSGHAKTMRDRLSDREFQVVRLIVEGLSNKEISKRLGLSDKTIKNHISHILAKLGLTARTQVAVLALRAGLAS